MNKMHRNTVQTRTQIDRMHGHRHKQNAQSQTQPKQNPTQPNQPDPINTTQPSQPNPTDNRRIRGSQPNRYTQSRLV